MRDEEIGKLTRWEIFTILVGQLDSHGYLRVDEELPEPSEVNRDRLINFGLTFARASQLALKASQEGSIDGEVPS